MSDSVARVETIFRVFRGDCMGHGSSGAIFAVSSAVAVKTACRYDNPPPGYAEEEQYSRKRIREESAIFDILAEPEHWHPNIVLSFLHSPDYIFMERTPVDLSDHVAQNFPISLEVTYGFLREIINAVSWLEQISFIHADVRPPNILIDGCGHVKLCDFDNATFIGKYIQVGNEPYYEEFDPGDFGIAGPESEQGAIGCCAYFICIGKEPESRSHATEDIGTFGTIIRKCWAGQYRSIKDLGEDMFSAMGKDRHGICQPNDCQAHVMDTDHYNACLQQCRQYLSINGVMAFVPDTDQLSLNSNTVTTQHQAALLHPSPLSVSEESADGQSRLVP